MAAAAASASVGAASSVKGKCAFAGLPLADHALLIPLARLPYISSLRPAPELLRLFLDEHKKDLAVKSARQLYDARRKIDRAKFLGETQETQLAWDALEVAIKEKNEVTEKLSKALNRHYRIMSLQLHPDKCGEDKRPAFEALTSAKNVLKDEDQRCNYTEEMMSVAARPDLASIPGLVQKGHNAWVKKYVPGVAPPPSTGKSSKKEKPLQLTGGLINDTPRKPRIYIQDLNERQIRVAMPPPTDSSEVGSWATYQFYNYCTRVTVLADEKRIITVQGEELERFAKAGTSEITVDLVLPQARRYDIRWFATLRMGESSPEQDTPFSSESAVDLTSPVALRRRGEIGNANELCIRRAGELKSALVHLRQTSTAGNKEAEARHWKLHGAMARGRGAEHRLVTLLREDGQMNDKGEGTNLPGGLGVVRDALTEAIPLQKELQEDADRAGKRTALKKFKNHVARTIEQGEAQEWLTDVTKDELKQLGGQPNRLYQLLVEGRGAKIRFDSLVLDSSALTAAATRDDLFTAKQCDALHERAAEMEKLAAEEAEKAAKEAKAKKEVERERQEAQMRGIAEKKAREAETKALNALLKQNKMVNGVSSTTESVDPRLVQGAVVLLHSLHSAASLNGSTATVEQVPDVGKCVVRCHADGVLRKVPVNNMQIWNGEEAAAPTPAPASASTEGWSCSTCTFHHEGAAINAMACQVCDAPRQPSRGSWTGVATKTSASHQGQRQEQQAPMHATARQPSNTKQGTAKSRSVATSSPIRTKAKKSSQQQNAKSPHRQHHQTLRCRDGASCRFLRQGPDVCHFRHTPEEFAAAAKYAKANAWIEHTLRISPAVVGWVIGKGGVHIRDVMEGSGAKLWIDQESMGPEDMRIVFIKGKKDSVETAVEMVKDLAYNAPYVGGHHTVVDNENKESEGAPSTSAAIGAADASMEKQPAPPAPTTKGESAKTSPSNPLQPETSQPQCQPARAEPVSPVLPATEPVPPPAPSSTPASTAAPATTPAPVPVHVPHTASSQLIVENNSEPFLKLQEPDDMGMPLQLSPSYVHGEIPHTLRSETAVVTLAQGFAPFPTAAPDAAPVTPVPQDTSHEGDSALLTFLELQKACLKGLPSDFHLWLSESEDIAVIEDLAEAVKDDSYVKEVLQPGDGTVGVKGFKRAAFKKAVLAAAEKAGGADEKLMENDTKVKNVATARIVGATQMTRFDRNINTGSVGGPADIPTELVCPITHVLMVQDPVLAADGMTYERSAIQMWFERQNSEVEAAQRELMVDPTSQRARSIVERGVLSPVTHTKMPSLSLIPNVALRTMARDVSRSSQSLY
eukprot:CAMPEP_0113568326 /NCGR_PEP_ID=MMETSP0015_2-20120614/23789_1 /TAXON_ID=2838 /ORGANISM="Odontella" /LENGTH=1317 /DNA_ID=CAMNT_0000470859 /DNA_START=374 /DNA_END=4327 /DNA_ORIENTATION=+ /assembly_acc=CAM_ASM_000160